MVSKQSQFSQKTDFNNVIMKAWRVAQLGKSFTTDIIALSLGLKLNIKKYKNLILNIYSVKQLTDVMKEL